MPIVFVGFRKRKKRKPRDITCMSWIGAPQSHIYISTLPRSPSCSSNYSIFNMEAIGAASSVIAIVELSAKVASVCLEYYAAVKDARDEITRLYTKVKELEDVAKDVQ
ncbi:hypothetical protein TWF225_005778 [Orbilia oligospora]|nr:hypothetical protein TWF225_005778 [Orbilia oligospora]KAF3271297.1 hypothetical protein TWF217_005696 [Orbilia oligospora]KAF3271854.1 hypothetical protein TWF128_000382 [Orbilia oligospora]KAF3293566.1 hypothetical protein TWF132_004534 [Orbilia oligospora]